MKTNLKRWIRIVLALVMVVSAAMFAVSLIEDQKAKRAYEEAQRLALEAQMEEEKNAAEAKETESEEIWEESVEETISEEETETEEKEIVRVWREVPVEDDPYMEELEEIDLEKLREVNGDVLGWIRIPDTVIDYPVMQGEDNDYYLNHTWEGVASKVGSIFLETLSSPDFTDHNTVIYGHKRGNQGTMFGPLHYYAEQDFYEKHPYVYIKNDTGVHRYEIFSIHEAPVGSMTYQIGFASDESRQKFLNYCMEMSEIDTGVIVTLDDRIITMSTCTGDGFDSRWVVQARLEGMWVEEELPLTSSADETE